MTKVIVFDLDDTLYDRTGQLDETYKNMLNIKLFSDAAEVLEKIPFRKFLVSCGDKKIQDEKIKVLGIKKYFEDIFIVDTQDGKKVALEKILVKTRAKASDIWVIGDKKSSEIRYGNMLGMNTVQMYHGLHKDVKLESEMDKPKVAIKKLYELLRILGVK